MDINYYNKTGETKSQRTQLMVGRVFSYIVLAFVTLLSLFPILLLIINATKTGSELQTGFSLIPSTYIATNFSEAMTSSAFNLPLGLINSFIIAASVCILTTYFSAMTAYGIHVYDFKLKKIAFNFILVIMMIPTQISAVGFIKMVYGIGLKDNFLPLILPSIAAPSVFFYMKQYIESSMPLEVIEAARVDGSNEFMTFNRIALPMLKPAIAVQLIFSFVASWNNFFTPALILTKPEVKTLPIMISQLKSQLQSGNSDLGVIYMVILISIIPVVIVYFFISKNIVEGVALGAVKG